MGFSPGRIVATRQLEPALTMKPLKSEGTRPARTSEDLPLPEVPTMAKKRHKRSLRSKSSISFSRPKKTRSSSAPNGRRPGKGLNRTLASCNSRLQLSNKRQQRIRRKTTQLRNYTRLVGSKPLFLFGLWSQKRDTYRSNRLDPA